MNYNKVILGGNLTRDPELKTTPSGLMICECALAINSKRTLDSGEVKEEVVFVDFNVFGKSGQSFAKNLRKGRCVLIEGRIRQQRWVDKATGKNRQKDEVVVESWQFADSKPFDDAPRQSAPKSKIDRMPGDPVTPATATAEDEPPF